jgi:hypothetical protein
MMPQLHARAHPTFASIISSVALKTRLALARWDLYANVIG